MLKREFLNIIWLAILLLLNSLTNLKVNAKLSENKITSDDLRQIKQNLVVLINESRSSLGLKPVALDVLASKVGELHCKEMLEENYFSHWNREGLKPYMRYSRAGGKDAIIENLSFSQGGSYYDTVERLTNILKEMHLRMFNETPPNDGHRQAIIYPYNTHVGIGIAFDEGRVKLAQEFICRYVEIMPLSSQAKAGSLIDMAGNILNPKEYELAGISIFYEPSPQTLTREELNNRGSYSLPETETILRPIVYGDIFYSDGSKGEIEYKKSNGKFYCQIAFPKDRKGVYTIVVWLKKDKEKFQATNISIDVS
ncbi:MAG: CAP domain-containing protein [Acidobacteria bacterium]|nr:CAP domain-containing protein [Acidobacteriota bacterium]